MRAGGPATVILSTVVGSHAYGLATAASDIDRRGVYAAPTESFWRFEKPPSSVDGPLAEQLTWEVEHFCALGLKGNPTVLEVLVSDRVEVCTDIGAELRALLRAFLSERVAVSYERATAQQLARATSAAEPKWKQVMHALRLLMVCRTLLATGELRIDMRADRDKLLAVRSGEVPLTECLAWADRLRTDIAAAPRAVPAEPDTRRVENWLVSVRRRNLDAHRTP
ncbi:nucleotidyltransferase domain-containing protein [Actinokineospora sp. HBU206404]|uniref:Nucleotidyltransferase domain-containing protein n=1 Tax=Actinokineospora xionganensis TaxID=2684470 RepID=A0ABR7LF31_9PSEU|nr:nucleotidyltransferase domain-containing protein [Actinokineospora xionganensis]